VKANGLFLFRNTGKTQHEFGFRKLRLDASSSLDKNVSMELSRNNIPPPPNPQIRYGKYESTLVPKPKFGVYLRWPEDGQGWIHPNDVELATKLIPSRRIWLRIDLDKDYWLIGYGGHSLRVKPTMWLEVPEPDFEVGDQVEIKSSMGKLQAKIATVYDVFWNQPKRIAEYHLRELGKPVPRIFHANDLQPTVRLGETLPTRHLGKSNKFGI
jgi:hypothetical protein